LSHEERVLVVGAQSSLTGGATPRGDAIVRTSRFDSIRDCGEGAVAVGPGVALITLQEHLRERGAFYPPAPTYTGAFVGGTVGTNAAGAATWKYGATRDWVDALTVVLACGDVLEVRRGQVHASAEGTFVVVRPSGEELSVPIPPYTMPDVPKRSAGYHAAPGMDLIDLFIGSEGTLGVITEVELRVLSREPSVLLCFCSTKSEAQAIELVGQLRAASRKTWEESDPLGMDVRAIESMDRRCLEVLREEGGEPAARLADVSDDAEMALFLQLELPADCDADSVLESFADGDAADGPIPRLFALLDAFDAMDDAQLALPGDRANREAILALREAVPVAVNHRVQEAQRSVDPRIHKVAGDMIVPFERFAEAQQVYRDELGGRGLDFAVWGHISDGNVHPNVLPRSYADVEAGHEAFLACGKALASMGGCPLSEHGTGRNPVKQELLRQLYGDDGIAAMRVTKSALDPEWKLARGVIFPAP
jgi:D-lactate dehydrogenase (cytochrome)